MVRIAALAELIPDDGADGDREVTRSDDKKKSAHHVLRLLLHPFDRLSDQGEGLMRRLSLFIVLIGLNPLLAGCGVPDAVAHGVKSLERSFGSGDPAAAAPPQPAPPPARTASEPPPPVAVQRDPVKVEELR